MAVAARSLAGAMVDCVVRTSVTSKCSTRNLCCQHFCTIQRAGTSRFWRRKMAALFHLHDADNNGHVDWKDYASTKYRIGQLNELALRDQVHMVLSLRRLWEQWLGPLDNSSGSMSRDQFVKILQRIVNRPVLKTAHNLQPPVWPLFYQIFEMIDVSKNGVLSPEEFRNFFHTFGLSKEAADLSFATVDTNSDGGISIDEFINMAVDFLYSEDEHSLSRDVIGCLERAHPEIILDVKEQSRTLNNQGRQEQDKSQHQQITISS